MRRLTASERVTGIWVASKPMSDISCGKARGQAAKKACRGDADIDYLLGIPGFRIVFYDSSLC